MKPIDATRYEDGLNTLPHRWRVGLAFKSIGMHYVWEIIDYAVQSGDMHFGHVSWAINTIGDNEIGIVL